jgi:putative ABC transport system permease protein
MAAFAARLLRREWRAGELTLLALAVVVAVAGVTTVGFFTQRVRDALDAQANVLLGADLAISGDRPLPPVYAREAQARGLSVVKVMHFPSMASAPGKSILSDIEVVTRGYPLRGELRIAERPLGADRRAQGIPETGTIWADERLFRELGVARGAAIGLGNGHYTLAAVITQEPGVRIGIFNAAPRILLNAADVDATGLVQPGSRIRYRLDVAGPLPAIDAYRRWASRRLEAGQRIEDVRDARPEVRSALERAGRFLVLAALVSVIVAAAGTALAARRYVRRHLDGTAVMRCLGATRSAIVAAQAWQLLLLAVAASVAGCAVGLVAQFALARGLAGLIGVALPAPSVLPAAYGLATGICLLLGFALPPLAALGRITPLRVLRRELGLPGGSGAIGYALGIAGVIAVVYWQAGELRLGSYIVAGFGGLVVAAALLAWLLVRALAALRYAGFVWRFGVANLQRHALGAVVQSAALAVGIMALLTLTLVRGELLSTWQRMLPERAPNRFVVGVQPEQRPQLAQFFRDRGIAPPELHPMVKGRLTQVNGKPVSAGSYADDRARRLVTREFNLSWTDRLQADNQLVAGRWWTRGDRPDQLSLEQGIASRLGLKLGDRLTFDVAGQPVGVTVTSPRKVSWDSFNVNFFALVPPGLLDKQPASDVTSFYLPPQRAAVITELVQRFPNLLVIDVAQVLAQVRQMMGQVARAVELVFVFTVLAGLVVLYAAISSAHDERVYQTAVLRALGARRAQLARATLAEFALAGAVAGLLGAAGASVLGYVLATRVLGLGYTFDAALWVAGVVGGAIAIAAAGYMGTRSVLASPPMRLLRDLG